MKLTEAQAITNARILVMPHLKQTRNKKQCIFINERQHWVYLNGDVITPDGKRHKFSSE